MTAYELNQRLKNFDLTTEIKKAIEQTKDKMADLNRKQLLAGKNTINNRIQPRYRNKRYAKKKNIRNAKPGLGVPDLFDEGNFHKSIEVKIKGKQYDFIAKDTKAPALTDKYPLILGLTAKATEQYSRFTLLPVLRNSLKNKLSR